MQQLSVESRSRAGGAAEIEVRGEVDLATVNSLRSAVVDAVAAGARQVTLLLDGVTYIDSAGLGTLIGAHKRLAALGGELVVLCDAERVLRLFRLTGVDRVLSIASREQAASA